MFGTSTLRQARRSSVSYEEPGRAARFNRRLTYPNLGIV